MGRAFRIDIRDEIYHVLNRANAGMEIFKKEKDYEAFESIIQETKEKNPVKLFSYCLMPNHWHFILSPKADGGLNKFMQRLTLTHTQRWHAHYRTTGYGHVYQGRYKSFIIQKENYFLQAAGYVERNALRADLVKNAQDWRWSSLWRRETGSLQQKELLDPWPAPIPRDYLDNINRPESKDRLELIRESVKKSRPFGDSEWLNKTVEKFGLEITIRNQGRPKNGS